MNSAEWAEFEVKINISNNLETLEMKKNAYAVSKDLLSFRGALVHDA